jgi:predicted ATPase/DNA-binding SARP family transcriptional activator
MSDHPLDATNTPWRLQLLGGLRATRDAREITRFRTRKTGLLLAYLAYYPQRAHPRDELVDLLWPEATQEAGRGSLSTSLLWLRHTLEPRGETPGSVLWTNRASVQLNPDAVVTDVAVFDAALREAGRSADSDRSHPLVQAVESYGGELLPGGLEDWVLQERQWLAERYYQALRKLSGLLEASGELDRAVAFLWQGIRIDPLQEAMQRELIRLLAASGQREAALRQYRELQRLLAKHLGTEPALETRALLRAIQDEETHPSPIHQEEGGDRGPAPAFRPEPEAPSDTPGFVPEEPAGGLPRTLTRFIDREREAAALVALLDRDAGPAKARRLVTLTGPGGGGKTRLALEVARRVRAAWEGAVCFVPLLGLANPHRLLDQIRISLRLPPDPDQEPLEAVVAALSRRPTLLLLDSLEHLLGRAAPGASPSPDPPVRPSPATGAEQIRSLLTRVPTLTILATSRLRLGVPGEQEFPVPPLPVPDRSDATDALLKCPSVQLFLDRAQAMRPGFPVTPSSLDAVAELCQGLEGLPLAVELAAARVGVLTPRQMVTRLSRRFELLKSRQREIDPRHGSLRETLFWSYQLLPPQTRQLFAQLSVFRGGWTLEGMEAVCDTPDALDCLEQLHESSLVLSEEVGNELRFRMLETVREFAAEQLAPEGAGTPEAPGPKPALEQRHAEWFLALAERAEPELEGPTQGERLSLLEMEHANFRAALTWSLGSSETASHVNSGRIGLRLATALRQFWLVRGHLAEGREWLERALTLGSATAPAPVRVRALLATGKLAYEQGDLHVAQSRFKEAETESLAAADRAGHAEALHGSGDVQLYQGRLSEARALYDESLAIYRALEDHRGVADLLNQLANLLQTQGDAAAATALNEESLALWRRLGDRRCVARVLHDLAYLVHRRGDPTTARALLDEGVTISREIGDRKRLAWCLNFLGEVTSEQDDDETARAAFEESLAIAREIGNPWGIGWALNGLGDVAFKEGDVPAACAAYEESLAVSRALNDARAIAGLLRKLGRVALAEDCPDEAAARYTESLQIQREQGNAYGIATGLEGLAKACAALGRPDRAARLMGSAAVILETTGDTRAPRDQSEVDELLSRLRHALGDAAFTAAWEAGRALSRETALADALAAES